MIRITLQGTPGSYTATATDGHETWRLATWERGADAGHVNATTDDGRQVSLAIADGRGGFCVGAYPHARRWTLKNVRWSGLTMTADSIEAPSDEWLEEYIERMARRVRG